MKTRNVRLPLLRFKKEMDDVNTRRNELKKKQEGKKDEDIPYIIDIGPEGGDKGGTVIAKGTPEEVAANPASYTGQYVKKYLTK